MFTLRKSVTIYDELRASVNERYARNLLCNCEMKYLFITFQRKNNNKYFKVLYKIHITVKGYYQRIEYIDPK